MRHAKRQKHGRSYLTHLREGMKDQKDQAEPSLLSQDSGSKKLGLESTTLFSGRLAIIQILRKNIRVLNSNGISPGP